MDFDRLAILTPVIDMGLWVSMLLQMSLSRYSTHIRSIIEVTSILRTMNAVEIDDIYHRIQQHSTMDLRCYGCC